MKAASTLPTVGGPRLKRLAGRAAALPGRVNWAGAATFAGVLALWEIVVRAGVVDIRFMASPTEIVGALRTLAATGELFATTGHTLRSVIGGWLLALSAGIVVGTLLGVSRRAARNSLATVDFMRSMPSIALVAPAVLIFGFSVRMELMVIVYGAIWPVIVNTMGGIQRVPAQLHDVARIFGLSRTRLARSIVLPAAAPSILVGARLAMALSLILAVVAEMVGNPRGLGYALVFEQQAIRPDRMFAYVMVIGLLGVALNTLLVRLASLSPTVSATKSDRAR